MAKIVSEDLVVRIEKKGQVSVFDLARIFNENPNRVVSVVGTVNEDGTPNTAPMSLFYCPDERTIIAGMTRASRTVENLRRTGRVIIEVLYDGDVGFGIIGRGTVIRDPLECNDATCAVKIEVLGVKRDTSPAQIITAGVRITPRSERAIEYEKAVMEELKGLS
ncbi:MAG: pyridoxamine 5'-phosphate oxidase family protein [Deltaproteobacteria bacterium]|nr:MAG: pyridoxamine 5'-phosphate oxidase family protein [Deltaproteobacteria bacterium]